MTKWVKEYIETVSAAPYDEDEASTFINDMHTYYEKEKPMTWPKMITRTNDKGQVVHLHIKDFQGLTHKTGELVDVSVTDMVELLGDPNSKDDPDKVKYSWRFHITRGGPNPDRNASQYYGWPEYRWAPVNIWDWKGSSKEGRWSFYGHPAHLAKLFGEDHVRAR